MKNIEDGLVLYEVKTLVYPDDKINITANGKIISYEGYIGNGVVGKINISSTSLDPSDEEKYID